MLVDRPSKHSVNFNLVSVSTCTFQSGRACVFITSVWQVLRFMTFVQANMQKMCLGSCLSRLEHLQSEWARWVNGWIVCRWKSLSWTPKRRRVSGVLQQAWARLFLPLTKSYSSEYMLHWKLQLPSWKYIFSFPTMWLQNRLFCSVWSFSSGDHNS